MATINGGSRADVLRGTNSADWMTGGAGDDLLLGYAGNDWLFGETGRDVLNGGAGSDYVDGGQGDDLLIYVAAENRGSHDIYNGWTGGDTLRLQFTGAEWAQSAVKADVARFLAYLPEYNEPCGWIDDPIFTFRSFGLSVVGINRLEVVVDGRVINPADAPVVTADDTLAIDEDASGATVDVLANDWAADGVANVSIAQPAKGRVEIVSTTFAAEQPSAVIRFIPGDAYAALAAGQTATEAFTYTVTDKDGDVKTATVNVTITGTNDVPVAVADLGAATEDGAAVIGSVAANDTDVDAGATLTYALVGEAAAGLTLAANGSWSFDPANPAYQALAAGETRTVTARYSVSDSAASAESTLTITVTGANDAPVAVADTGAANEDAALLTGSVAANDTDADAGATLSYALVGDAPAGLTLAADGSWSFDPANTAYQSLAAGEVRTVIAAYRVSDGTASAESTLTITVTGTNDAPVAVAAAAAANEDGAPLTGRLAASDADAGAALTFALVGDAPAGIVLAADGAWSFNASDPAYQALAAGEVRTVVTRYSISDGVATTESTLTITVTGTNDTPVATADTGAALEGVTASGSVAVNDRDADAGTVLTYRLTGDAPAGLVMAADGSWTFNASDPAYDALAPGETRTLTADYAVGDGTASAASTLTITVTGTNDAPVVTGSTDGVVSEDAEDGGVFVETSGVITFADLDGRGPATVSVEQPEDPYGEFEAVLTEDGKVAWTFNSIDFPLQRLGAGESVTQTYKVTVEDGQGGSVTEEVSVTINGSNDPIQRGEIDGANLQNEGNIRSGTTRIYFYDLDDTDVHTATITPKAEGYVGTATVEVVQTDEFGEGYIDLHYSFPIDEIDALPADRLRQSYEIILSDGNGDELVLTRNVTLDRRPTWSIGGSGDDEIDFINDGVGDILIGNGGRDYLFGGSERDELYGDQGPALPQGERDRFTDEGNRDPGSSAFYDDTLEGNGGGDLLVGGAGADIFRFDFDPEDAEADGDVIRDFNAAEGDVLVFDGYGAGATFERVSATEWVLTSGDGSLVETLTFANAVDLTAANYYFF